MNTETENTGRNNTHTQEPARPRKVAPKTAAESGSRPVQPRKPKAPGDGAKALIPPGAAASLIIVLLMLLVQGAWGALTTTPASPISISGVSAAAPGVLTNYLAVSKAGSDASGRRGSLSYPFLTITAAKTNASAGDTIIVYPGVYNEHDLVKKGVNYQFFPGVSNYWICQTNTLADALGFFDDRSTGATTNRIYGKADWYFSFGTNYDSGADCHGNTNGAGAVVLTNAASDIVFEAHNISGDSWPECAGAAINGVSASPALFYVSRCRRCEVTVYEMLNPGIYAIRNGNASVLNGFYWESGETHFTSTRIGPFSSYGIWPNEAAGQGPQNLWVTGNLDEGYTYASGITANFKVWFNFKEIRSTNGATSDGMNFITGGKYYVQAEKISSLNANGNSIHVNGGEVWLNAQKITAPTGGTCIKMDGGTNRASVIHLEEASMGTGVSIVGGLLVANFYPIATNFISGQLYTNHFGTKMKATCSATHTAAGTMEVRAIGIATNYFSGTGTNQLSIEVPVGGTYTFTNTAGTGGLLNGGQISF